jgi:hypothetical protein
VESAIANLSNWKLYYQSCNSGLLDFSGCIKHASHMLYLQFFCLQPTTLWDKTRTLVESNIEKYLAPRGEEDYPFRMAGQYILIMKPAVL